MLRRLWRVPALVLHNAFWYGLLLVAVPLLRPFSERVSREAHWRIIGIWARGSASILGVRLHVIGEVPTGSFFLATNHLGYLDIVVLLCRTRARFVSKAEVEDWPVMGHMARTAGTIFLDRTTRSDVRRVVGLMEGALEASEGVVLFPEGTSTGGAEVLPFRPSLFEAPVRLDLPVRTACLHYSTPAGSPPASLCVCWWGDMTFGKHFWNLLALPSIEASVTFGSEPVRGSDRKALATAARGAVLQGFRPMEQDPASPENPGFPAATIQAS